MSEEVAHALLIEKRVFKEYLVFQIFFRVLVFEIQIQILKISNPQIQI